MGGFAALPFQPGAKPVGWAPATAGSSSRSHSATIAACLLLLSVLLQ